MTDQVNYFSNGMAGRSFKTNPRLLRSGIATEDCGEMTPVVFRRRLMLLGSAQTRASANPYRNRCLWIEDVARHRVVATFAEGYGLGSGFVHDDTFHAFAVPSDSSGAKQIDRWTSTDLKHWQSTPALRAEPGEDLFNESVCEADGRFVMAYEVRDARHVPFTIKFAESADLKTWRRIPVAIYATDRYTACPTIRYCDGMFHLFYLEHLEPRRWFETYLARSADLIHWERSPRNPVLDPQDVEILNASDMDLVEFDGKVWVYYLDGDQLGCFRMSWATFDGSLKEFFRWYFPAPDATGKE